MYDSLPREDQAGRRARAWLAVEFAVLFVMLPVALLWRASNTPVLVAFFGVFAACQLSLWLGSRVDHAEAGRGGASPSEWRRLAVRFVILGGALTAAVAVLAPENLFDFPRRAPAVWLVVLLLYPLLSAYPQEVIYRAFMFRRYARLFRTSRRTLLASAISFGWAHLLLESWVAVALTVIGGWLFGDTYGRTRSLTAVTVEHALYGALVFTIGLGRTFYLGSVRP